MRFFTTLIFLLIYLSVYTQVIDFSINGKVTSDIDKKPLESATVYVQNNKDSTVIAYTITDAKGIFKLNDTTSEKELNFFISYVGYYTFFKKIAVKENKIDLGNITLIPSNQLDEVVIKSTAPITIKKDTLEFNVSSFKTKKNATIEDLLKKLPGVEVSSNGQIKVNGREVNKILVNGKPFFSNDPTIATRSLSKDFIDKIQISSTKSKEEAFSNERGSDTKRTINFVIKKDKGKGTFGRLSGGIGTDERYELAGIVNHFNDDSRLSALGGGNNINSPGFSFGEIQKMFGSGNSSSQGKNDSFEIDGRQFGGEEGIITSRNAGLNYTNDIGKTVEYSANHFYSGANSDFTKTTTRESLIPDLRFITRMVTNSNHDLTNHNSALDFDIVIDSTFLITARPAFKNSKGISLFNQTQQSLNLDDELINTAETMSSLETDVDDFSNQLGLTKRLGDKGSFIKLKFNTTFNNSETENFLFTSTTTFEDQPNTEIRDLFSTLVDDESILNANTTYRLPLKGYNLFLDFKYGFNSTRREFQKNTFQFNEVDLEYDQLNTDFSASIDFLNQRSSPGLSLGFVQNKWSLTVGANYALIYLKNDDALRSTLTQNQRFKALETEVFYAYNFKPGTLFNLSYSLRNRVPNFNTLQSYQEIDNPLNTIVGNPNLELSKQHQLFAIYNALNFEKGSSFKAIFSGVLFENQIVSSTITDADLTSLTTYANVDGFYQLNTDIGYSKKLKINENENLRYSLGLKTSLSNFVSLNNGLLTNTKTFSVSPNFGLNYTLGDFLEIEPSYSLEFNDVTFDLITNNNQSFIRHTIKLNTALELFKVIDWRNNITYFYNPNVASGFQKTIALWNTTLDYSFLKNKATASLKIYDLLNQNTDVMRRSGANFIEDSQGTILQQYFMLGLSWRFDTFNKNDV